MKVWGYPISTTGITAKSRKEFGDAVWELIKDSKSQLTGFALADDEDLFEKCFDMQKKTWIPWLSTRPEY